MTELDKFKRRMIRAVARLLQEKKAEDELWDQMKKETGCDCRLLWERMRALTLKKLRRLLLSEDKSENVASIARMSLTDWLLFDLVLVHEKIDFIERDVLESNKEMKPLIELFYLVQKFQIESLRSNALADAWTAATVIYNSKGHQCSPMLLQRRWYQLKEATRERFYTFWFKYRGNAKALTGAGEFMPSRLQAAIAKRYNDVITKPFLDWDKMIDERLVILPDEFESKMRNINFTMPVDSNNDPELILVEPIIETIDLGADSDSDQQEQSPPTDPKASNKEIPPYIRIKREPKDTTINDDDNSSCDAEMLRAMNKQLPQKVLDATSIEEQALLESENETLNALVNKSITTGTGDIVVDAVSDDVTVASELTNATDVIMPQISNVFGNVTSESLSLLAVQTVNEVVSETSYKNTEIELKTECLNTLEDSYSAEIDTNIESEDSTLQQTLPEAEQIVSIDTDENNLVPLTINSSDDDIGIREGENSYEIINETEDTNHATNVEFKNAEVSIGHLENKVEVTVQNIASLMPPDATSNVKVEVEDVINLDEDNSDPQINNLTENIVTPEHAEDAVENLDNIEDDIICIRSEDILSKPTEIQDPVDKVEDFPVDVNFADDGIEFVDDGIEFFDEDDDSNSKTNDENIMKHLPIKCEADEETPKFDLKLLLNPIVYTKKLDDLSIFTDNVFDVKSKDLIDYIEKECKPLCVMSNDVTNIKQEIQDAIATSANDDLLNNDSSEESDFEDIPESCKVKISSYLLQKPKSRTYNPIQLCKNPDFNTRLKRLPVGFFSSTRNCRLLKSCKPMTIDVNKTFENKLINGTIYLKSNNVNDYVVNYVEEEKVTESNQTVSVLPSAMAAQSLIDNTIALPASKQMNIQTDYIRPILTNKSNDNTLISERSRVINLPDISQIRRINQKLLTAEVTPIRVQPANDPSNTALQLVANMDCDVETNASGGQPTLPNVSEVINVPDKPASVVVEVDKKPLIIPDQNQTNIPSKTSSNASKIKDFIKQIEATGSEIAKADPKPDIISCQVNDKMPKDKNPKPKNPPNKYSKRIYPEVSWLSAKRHPIIKNDDTLLTLDTLNKMLNIINGDVIVDKDGQFQINKKKEKKASQQLQSKDSKIEGPPSKSKKTEKASSKSKDQHIIEKMRKTKKPRIKIIPGSNRKDDLPQKKKGNCCCHKPSIEKQVKQNAACVVLSDDDDETALHNACESIERVVRQTHEEGPKTASVSIVQAKKHEVDPKTASVAVVQAKKMLNAEVQTTNVEVMRTPIIEIDVTSSPVEGVEPLDIQAEKELTPPITNIKINKLIGSDGASVVKTTVTPALCGSTMIVNDKLNVAETMPLSKQKKVVKHTVNIQTSVTNSKSDFFIPNQSMQVDSSKVKRKYINSYRTVKRVLPESYYQSIPDEDAGRQRREKKLLYKYQAMPCSCRLPSVSLDTPKRHIIIDGSTSCALHNQTNTNIKHKLLLMNSKNISREPTERPISLGKNKILLTTVKLPKHTQPPPDLLQNPQVIPSLPLPSGVQLILLPTGELTYFVEPSVQLNDEQMSSIPIIMAAVKQQLDTCSVPPTPVANEAINNDIVNISDDESATSVNNTVNNPQTNNSNNVDVESQIEKYTINETFIKNLNKSKDSKTDLNENSKKETNDVNNIKEHSNKDENNTDVTLNLNINKEINDGDHMNENVNKMTVGVDGPNRNVCIETNNTNDNLNVNVNTQSNVEDNILNENDYKEKNVVGDLIENVNEVKKNVKEGNSNVNVNEEKKVGDHIENITTENNAVDDSNDNVNKEKKNIHDSIENMETETNVEGELKKNLNEDKINFRNDDVDKEHKDSESATNSTAARKTILSDLMEMSGISAEDTVSMSQQNVTSENIEGTLTDNGTLLNMHNVVPPLVPLSNIIHETDVDTANIPELTPITSLSELKYACEQEDGQFFKLDLDTGVLIPINVCIKKHTKHSSSFDTSRLLKPIAPKEVMIDLTDDNDILVEENESSEPMMYNNLVSRNNYKSLLKSARGDNSVKPIKIFKSVHANILRKQFRNNLTESKVCVELDKKKSRKRKQRLSQIEAKIDLVDSDAPMEEEYLMDSCDDSLDSSDDEPLAAIAKRKRAENTVTNIIEGDKVVSKSDGSNAPLKDTSDKSEVHMDTTDVPLNRREAGNNYGHTDVTQAPTAATEVPSHVTYTPDVTVQSPDVVSEIGSSQLPCDDDINEPPQISFLSDNNYDSDESEENCILGV